MTTLRGLKMDSLRALKAFNCLRRWMPKVVPAPCGYHSIPGLNSAEEAVTGRMSAPVVRDLKDRRFELCWLLEEAHLRLFLRVSSEEHSEGFKTKLENDGVGVWVGSCPT